MRRVTRVAALGALGAGLLAVMAGPAWAQELNVEELAAAIDTAWVAVAAALVLLMHLGFALVETGLTRAKNAANIVGKNMATVAIGAVAYWATGAAFAYGDDVGGLFGASGFFAPITTSLGDGTQVIFQLVFAATAATIVSGAVAERIKFTSYLIVALAMTAVIYPIITHWQWYGEGGWLFDLGFYDFAGSSLVHLTGGAAGLAGVLVLGPRIGKYGRDGRPRAIPGHNIPFAIAGVLVLWFGWFGFNGGSTLGAVGLVDTIGVVLLNTTIAGGAGAIGAMAVSWWVSRKPDPAMIGNGALAGLVGITAGPDLAGNGWAVVVGLVCGAVVVGSVILLDRLRVDDPVGAISVHGTCGAIGTLFVGLYSAEHAVGTQLVGVASVGAFSFAAAGLVFLALKATIGVRVSEQEEIEGLDGHEHGVYGYPGLVLGPSADPASPRGSTAAPVPGAGGVRVRAIGAQD